MFTGRYGLSSILVDQSVDGGGGEELPLGENTPFNFVIIDSDCNVLTPINNGGTYVVGQDLPAGIDWNIRFEFSDPGNIRYTTAAHTQVGIDNGIVYRDNRGQGYDGVDEDGSFLMRRGDCSDGAVNTVPQTNRADVENSFNIRIVPQDNISIYYDLSFRIVSGS